MNFIYNEADAMLIDGGGIHFLKTRADDAASSAEAAELDVVEGDDEWRPDRPSMWQDGPV